MDLLDRDGQAGKDQARAREAGHRRTVRRTASALLLVGLHPQEGQAYERFAEVGAWTDFQEVRGCIINVMKKSPSKLETQALKELEARLDKLKAELSGKAADQTHNIEVEVEKSQARFKHIRKPDDED